MLTDRQSFVDAVINYIQTKLLSGLGDAEISAETKLLESGVLSSLSLFKLISHVQKEFGVKVKPNEITLENFASISTIYAFLEGKSNAQSV